MMNNWLLANSAHKFRTSLNAVINYLEIALEGPTDQESRKHLSKLHSASKSLVSIMNDLLDLTKTEEGCNLIEDDVFDFPATIREAANTFVRDAKRKEIHLLFLTRACLNWWLEIRGALDKCSQISSPTRFKTHL